MVWIEGKCERCESPLEEGEVSPCLGCRFGALRATVASIYARIVSEQACSYACDLKLKKALEGK